MSKIGGQNEVAAMSVGLTVDTAGLDASLAEARKKLDDFKQQSDKVPIKPIDVGKLPVDKTDPNNKPFDAKGSTYQIDQTITPGNAGKGPGYDLAPEIDKTDQAVKKSAFSWKELSQEIRNASSAVFGFVGLAGTVAAGLASAYGIGKMYGEMLADTARKTKELADATMEFNRVFDFQNATMRKTQDRRLAASGVLPNERENLFSRQDLAQEQFKKAQLEEVEAEQSYGALSFLDDVRKTFIGGETAYEYRVRLAKERRLMFEGKAKDASGQIDKMTNDVPVSGFINTDAGLGSSVRTMSISNVRMDQRDEQARKAEYSQRQVEANRRRSP